MVALVVLFVALRLLLVFSASDRIHAPDWAEAKHSFLGDRWILAGPPSLGEVLETARESRNAAHGGFLPLSALYAVLSVPYAAPDNQLALKLSAIAFATLGFCAWLAVAIRIGGALAGWLTALLALFPPPIYLAGSLVTWGSHPEASALLGVAALLLLRESSTRCRGLCLPALALGTVGAMSSLLLPITLLLLIVWLRGIAPSILVRRRIAVAALAWALPLLLAWWLTGALGSSITEEAGNAPLDLVLSVGDGLALIPATLGKLIPLPCFGAEVLGRDLSDAARAPLDWILFALLLCSLAHITTLSRHPARGDETTSAPLARLTTTLLVGAPALHLGILLLVGPRRPSVELRYLLPVFPILGVAIAVAAALAWRQRKSVRTRAWAALLLCSVIAWSIPGMAVQAALIEPARIGALSGVGPGFMAWRSPRYIDYDIGNVRYETAPGVNDFLSQRGTSPAGFALVPRLTAGQDLLRSLEPPVIDAARLLDRIRQDRATQPVASPERTRIYENIGWALAVFAPDRPGLWMALLSHLGSDRSACAAGLGMGLSRTLDTACTKIQTLQKEDRHPAWAGAASLDAAFRQSCPSPQRPDHQHQHRQPPPR